MKHLKIVLLCICVFLFSLLPVSAKDTQTILVYSNDLSVVILITPIPGKEAEIVTIPTDTVLPIQCANNAPASLASIAQADLHTCMMDTLSAAFAKPVTNYIYLDGKKIDLDYPLTTNMQDIKRFDQLQDYFSALGQNIQMSVIWKFPEYMETDVSLWELYDFYQLYISDDFSIQYQFPHLIKVHNKWFAIDRTLYPAVAS